MIQEEPGNQQKRKAGAKRQAINFQEYWKEEWKDEIRKSDEDDQQIYTFLVSFHIENPADDFVQAHADNERKIVNDDFRQLLDFFRPEFTPVEKQPEDGLHERQREQHRHRQVKQIFITFADDFCDGPVFPSLNQSRQ